MGRLGTAAAFPLAIFLKTEKTSPMAPASVNCASLNTEGTSPPEDSISLAITNIKETLDIWFGLHLLT